MAMAALRAVSFQASIPPFRSPMSSNHPKALRLCFSHRNDKTYLASRKSSLRFPNFVLFASEAGATEVEPVIQESPDSLVDVEDSSGDVSEIVTSDDAEEPVSAVMASLESYREALVSGDESKISEVTSFFKSIEDEKLGLENKLVAMSQEMSSERDRVLRISADFDNFRKRTERERSSLVSNAQGEVVEMLLGVLDNFERAKAQIKVENEKEEKINNSYQSIYKQLNEILTSLGVVPVETVGKPFDPLEDSQVGLKFNRKVDELKKTLHEAIMREDSNEFGEGIVLQEFRKGFRLGERLLRPSMVKVSAGPGLAKPEQVLEESGVDESNSTEAESQGAESA